MITKYLRRLLVSEFSSLVSLKAHRIAAPPASAKPACKQGPLLMPSSNRLRASDCSCHLPLPTGGRHSLPSSSSSSCTLSCSSAEESNFSAKVQFERSQSYSTLQRHTQLKPSFKPLVNSEEASTHDHLNRKYARTWSSPSLRLSRHVRRSPRKARSLSDSKQNSPADHHGCSRSGRAPKGHVAVYVEAGQERQVVPIAYLSHPLFQLLLERAEREYGFRQGGPGLAIPCSLPELQHTLHHIRTQSL